MNTFSVINYQGSKKKLSEFLYNNIYPYLEKDKAFLDIFSGSGAVCNTFKNVTTVYANDAEKYSSLISDAILNKPEISDWNIEKLTIHKSILSIIKQKKAPYSILLKKEHSFVNDKDLDSLVDLYNSIPTVWNEKKSLLYSGVTTVEKARNYGDYYLFTQYYSNSYFGLLQAIEIDSIIEYIKTENNKLNSSLFSCLFYAMKEASFSKDGHLAQPLDFSKNKTKLFLQRSKSILKLFEKKLDEYISYTPGIYNGRSIIYNEDFKDLLKKLENNQIGIIYADPPYTDMQYSRYYHLLNIAIEYNYPELTKKGMNYTNGLYTVGRFQSNLSKKEYARLELEELIKYCKRNDIKLALSYAFPCNVNKQKTDRYVISIEDLIDLAKKYFNEEVNVKSIDYHHSNNRNSQSKKVKEYLIVCGKKAEQSRNIKEFKNAITSIKPSKNNPLYNSHMYWSQKSYNICDALIEEYTQKDDIVFDPFLGSGVTVFEALKLNRRAIGCEINDMPIFNIETILSLSFSNKVINELEQYSSHIEILNKYYETTCPICGEKAITKKVLFDKPSRNSDSIKIIDIQYVCPTDKSGVKKPSESDYEAINHSENLRFICPEKFIKNSKIAVGDNEDIRCIFTNRNLVVLDHVISISKKYSPEAQKIIQYILISILHLCKITDTHSNSQWPLWIPKKNCVEKNVIEIIQKRIKKFNSIVIPYIKQTYDNKKLVSNFIELKSNSGMLIKKGCQFISTEDIPDNSVDLIITDPPYMEQVLYSEYMQLYKPFFHLNFNLDDEIVVSSSPERKKNEDNYFSLLDQAFSMCSKKLKPGKCMCLYFHDSNLKVWSNLINILEKNNFKFISQVHISKTVTLKNIISPKKSLNGDSILFFELVNSPIVHNSKESLLEIEENIIKQAKYMVKQSNGLTTPELYDNGLMEILIQNGWLNKISKKYSSLVEIFDKIFTWSSTDSKWKLI